MKKILLFIAIFATIGIQAQTTFELDWEQGVMGGDASFTIAVGDIVKWTWSNGAPHSVTSIGGTETFDSGIITGSGTEFMFTFNNVGATDYQCDVHPASMFGTITVEATMGVQERYERNVQMYPNPTEDSMTIVSLHKVDYYEIYDVFGKKVGWGDGEGNYTVLNTSYLNSGAYFMTVVSDEGYTTTKKIIKR